MSKSEKLRALWIELSKLDVHLAYCEDCMQGPSREDWAWGTAGADHTRREIKRVQQEIADLEKEIHEDNMQDKWSMIID